MRKEAVHMGQSAQARGSRDLTQGSIFKTLLLFAIPIVLANLIQNLYNLVDMFIIGQFVVSTGTVAVHMGGQITTLLTSVGMGFSQGSQILVSQQFGARDREGVSRTVGTLFTMLGFISIVCMVGSMIFSGQIIALMNTPVEAVRDSRDYLFICCLGIPFIFGYNAACAILRGIGDSTRPLIFVAVAAVTNVVLDTIFVAVFQWGAAGTAWATVASQAVSFLAAIRHLWKKRDEIGFDFLPRSFWISRDIFRQILRLGIPLVVQSSAIHFSLLYVNSFINDYGLSVSSANGIGQKIQQFLNVFVLSINTSCGAMIGQNLGARQKERAKQVVYAGLTLTMAIFVLNTIISLAIPRQLIGLFDPTPEVIEYGVIFLRTSIAAFFLSAFMGPCGGMVTGTGFTTLGLINGLLDGVVLRIGLSFLFANTFGMGVVGFWLGSAMARLAPAIINSIYFFGGFWRKRALLVKEKSPVGGEAAS